MAIITIIIPFTGAVEINILADVMNLAVLG